MKSDNDEKIEKKSEREQRRQKENSEGKEEGERRKKGEALEHCTFGALCGGALASGCNARVLFLCL